MFAWWGRTVYRFRYIVIGVMVALCLGGGVYGISLGEHVTQSGFYDDGSQSVAASIAADKAYGRDRTSHVVAILTPPDGKKVDDPDWMKKTTEELDSLVADHPDQIEAWVGWLKAPDTTLATVQQMKTEDLSKTFVSIPLKGDDDDTILKNYQVIEPDLQKVNGGNIQLAGLNPLNGSIRWEAPIATPRGTNDVERLVDLVGRVSRVGNSVCARAFQASVGCVDTGRGLVSQAKGTA